MSRPNGSFSQYVPQKPSSVAAMGHRWSWRFTNSELAELPRDRQMADGLLAAMTREHRDRHQESARAQGFAACRAVNRARLSDRSRMRSRFLKKGGYELSVSEGFVHD